MINLEHKEAEDVPHEQMIAKIFSTNFGQKPKSIERMATGICNEVYSVALDDKELIVRLSLYDKFLMGSHHNIPVLKFKGIPVPDILKEDYSRTEIPMAYQIQSKIEGTDLGNVIDTLTDEQLKKVAENVANVFEQLKEVPTNGKFGEYPSEESSQTDTWTAWIERVVHEAIKRGEKTGVMDSEMKRLLLKLLEKNKPYFDIVESKMYFADITSKNVMVDKGKFKGLVDLDSLLQGDPLEAVGRIKTSWPGTHYGDVYANAIMENLNLSPEQKDFVSKYALMHAILWACENGIQFNKNTVAMIDQEKLKRDRQRIAMLADCL